MNEQTDGELIEQRHQLMDLDQDSQWTDYPGSECVSCPPASDQGYVQLALWGRK